MTIAILKNAALLLALAFVYDVVVLSRVTHVATWVRTTLIDAATGVVLGLVGVAVMASSWELEDGVILDTRSVVLTIVGLFFGAVPVVLAMILTVAYRVAEGGIGAPTGVAVIIATGLVGLAARQLFGPDLRRLSGPQLAITGVVSHLVMLVMFVVVPFEGSTRLLVDIAVPVMVLYPGAVVLVGLVLLRRRRDVEVARQLAESESRYRSVFDNDHLAVMVIDPIDGRILEVNERAIEYYGWSRRELLEMSASDLEVLPRPDVLGRIDEGLARGRSSLELEHRLASGEIRDVEVIGGAVTIGGRECVHVVINDVTDRKRVERELAATQEQLQQAQKMEAIGRLAGGIAHDFNNMLQVILGYADAMRAEIDPDTESYDYLTEIHDAARRSADLTQQLLAFARRQPATPRVLDLDDAVRSSRQMLQRLVGEQVRFEWLPADDLWPVRFDAGQLGQVLANLALNASDAVGPSGHLRISAANVVIDEVGTDDPVEARPGEYVDISVADDGSGIPDDVVDSIFDPFFTTRGGEGGTGLGLSIVYGVITQHGGFIRVETRTGVGTTFHLLVPRAEADAGDEAVPWDQTGDVPRPPAAGTTVLLVEDEPSVLRLSQRTLSAHGYEVVTAPDAGTALALATARGGGIDMVVTDVVMPGLDVRSFLDRLRLIQPDVTVLYVSGYPDDVVAERGILDGGIDLLAKPFSGPQLLARVEAALNGDGASSDG
ncbi:MAG: ATP-binding protein [Ilumatobacteraceae bacterium]